MSEELDQAEIVPEEVPLEESAPSEEVETEEIESAVEPEEPEAPKESNGVQKRINELTAKKYAADSRANAAEAKLAQLESQQQAQPTQQGSPKLEDFDYDEEAYIEAKADYQANQVVAKIKSKQQAQEQEAKRAETNATFRQRIDEAGIEDYKEVVGNLKNIPISSDILDAIQSDDKGPQIAHYLGGHLDVAERIAMSNPVQAALELGKLSAKFSSGKPTKKPTQATPPPKIVGGGGNGVNSEPGEKSMEQVFAESTRR